MVYGIYGLARSDSAFRMMNIANAQMSMMNNINANTDMNMLHKMDMRNSLALEKEKFNYKMLDNLDKMNKKIVEQKFKNK